MSVGPNALSAVLAYLFIGRHPGVFHPFCHLYGRFFGCDRPRDPRARCCADGSFARTPSPPCWRIFFMCPGRWVMVSLRYTRSAPTNPVEPRQWVLY